MLATVDSGVPLQTCDTPMSPAFVSVRVVPDTLVEVVLPSGITLKLPLGSDVEHVARLVKAVATC